MPLITIEGTHAFQNLKSNRFRTWPRRGTEDTNRIDSICKPAFEPSFRIDRSDRIFAIGSCFARNIERALEARGFDVATAKVPNADPAFTSLGRGILNNYGVPSILNELQWAFCPEHRFEPEENIFQTGPGLYHDIHLNPPPDSLATVLARRAAIQEITKRVTECRVVVITLGLSEVWFDTQTQRYINFTVPRSLIAKFPSRFQVHVLDHTETIESLNKIVSLLGDKCRKDQRIVLTISPVPLNATFTTKDVVVANSYSKAVLRAAAEHVVTRNHHIDYFPSYESVMLSDRLLTWDDDNIHVSKRLIEVNVDRMILAYTVKAEVTSVNELQAAVSEAEEAMEAGDDLTAIKHLEPLRDFLHLDESLASTYSTLCISLKRFDDALAAINCLPEDKQGCLKTLVDAMLLLRSGKSQEAIDTLNSLASQESASFAVFRHLTEVLISEKRFDEAITVARRWSLTHVKSGEPFRRIADVHAERKDFEQADRAFKVAMAREPTSNRLVFDYVEFLITRGRLHDAAMVLARAAPETKSQLEKAETLRACLPEVTSTVPSKGNQAGVLLSDDTVASAREGAQRREELLHRMRRAEQLFAEKKFNEVVVETESLMNGVFRLRALKLKGRALVRCNRSAEGEIVLRAALQEDAQDPAIFSLLGSALFHQDKYAEAVESASKAVEIHPEKIPWRAGLVRILIKARKFSEATSAIDGGLAIAPDNLILLGLREKVRMESR